MSTIEIKAYEIFKNRFQESDADIIIDYIEQKTEKKIDNATKHLATKDDIISLQLWLIGIFITLALMIIGLYIK